MPDSPLSARLGDRARRVLLPAAGLLVGLALWWLVTVVLTAPGDMLARFNPADAFASLFGLIAAGRLWAHAADSLGRLAGGLAIAFAVGIPIGLAVGLTRSLQQATGPLFQLLRMISPLSWAPIALIAFGVGGRAVTFLIAVAAVWPVIINTSAGVKALDPGWRMVAASLHATRLEVLRSIVLPGVRTHVFTGARVALGVAWIVLVPAEMLGVNSGLGYFVLDTRDRLAYDELMATILFIGVLGYLLDALAQRLSAKRWTTGPGNRLWWKPNRRPPVGETVREHGAEGATAPESLRHTYRGSEAPLESGR